MARMFVTGSSDGIGRRTAADLIAQGHDVVLHARNEDRAAAAIAATPGAAGVLVGDLSSLESTRALAARAGEAGPFDVVIHNAGIGGGQDSRLLSPDGLELILQVNALAPYLLTALMPLPKRLVYLTSGLESDGIADLDDLQWQRKPWNGMQAYSDSKLWDVVLAFALARRRPEVISNAVDPGWIRTKLGGPAATDDLPEGAETQVWLASSDDPAATASGRYLKRRQVLAPNPAAGDIDLQEAFLAECARLTGSAWSS